MTSHNEILKAGLSALSMASPLDKLLLEFGEKQTYLNILQSVANAGIHFDIKTVAMLRSSIIETKTEIENLKHRIDFLRAMPKSSGKTIKFRRYAYHPTIVEKKMGIKVTSKNLPSKVPEFPVIMRHKTLGFLILFCNPGSGVILSPESAPPSASDPLGMFCFGNFSDGWNKEDFEPWRGYITIEQA